MTNQNSDLNNSIRPEALQSELSIGRDTYYSDLKHLGIKAERDEDGKAFLTFNQANQVRALRLHVSETGSRRGFTYQKVESENNIGSIVKADNNSIEATEKSVKTEIATATEEDIYLTEQETNPTNKVNLDSIINNAQELAARNLALPELLAVELANNMSYEDLTPELQAKIDIARDAANPKKHQPKLIAQTLLKQFRSQRVS